MIRCASCGAENPDDNNFCDQCGASLSIIKTENNVSAEYANNPFDANSSTSRKAYNNPFEEKPLSSQNNEKCIKERLFLRLLPSVDYGL